MLQTRNNKEVILKIYICMYYVKNKCEIYKIKCISRFTKISFISKSSITSKKLHEYVKLIFNIIHTFMSYLLMKNLYQKFNGRFMYRKNRYK